MDSLAYVTIISIIFFIVKFIYVKLKKSDITLKYIIQDTCIVFLSSSAGFFIISQFNDNTEIVKPSIKAFTDNPQF